MGIFPYSREGAVKTALKLALLYGIAFGVYVVLLVLFGWLIEFLLARP